VTVADTGCGMPAEVVGRVFEPSFSTMPDGHGLGLAVVRGAAEAHRGAVRVQSTPGAGTVIELLLPE
jgi:signal transduction histidine kinase